MSFFMASKRESISIVEDSDAIDSYFECITACAVGDDGGECITKCIEVHLKSQTD
ncbi:Hypothetical protein P9211_14171 [Prochlorococcus marinus str. MIT 9211]|uniref:Uncharacterized protein n=2 Tax=Prochlorococcus marinus TaxID=1219 RepID=A9BBY6_PROM4|nr:Hypothetical protein P9211_14171 [Prochlorococcus marinus str. MIT 9211]